MKARYGFLYGIVLLSLVFALYGCPKDADVSSASEPQVTEPAPAEAPQAEAAPVAEAQPAAGDVAPQETATAGAGGLEPIYFDFDKSFIRDDMRSVMKANADWLKANPKAKVRIEGNCDERGTIEYNQALGQRRAASAKKFLTNLGISAKRISLISYGKEKPACTASDEDCWQKNRRDDLVSQGE